MEKVLTVSVAAYNAAADIDNCLNSMLCSNVADLLEIIVVNDGSTDNTAEIVHKYELEYPGIIKLINKANGGHGSTINTSIVNATGKYYRIVDSDDWVDKAGIEKLVWWLKENDVDLVFNPYCKVAAKHGYRKTLSIPYGANQIIGTVQPIESADKVRLQMHSMVFKTEIVKQMGAIISENCFYVDTEYIIFPMLYVNNFACLDFPVYQYLFETTTQSMNINNLIKRKDQHLRMTKRIAGFYQERKADLKKATRRMILQRIEYAVSIQYRIYAKMNLEKAIEEVKAFDKWLKECDREIYESSVTKFMAVIRLNRRTAFKLYKVMMRLLKFMGMEPKL